MRGIASVVVAALGLIGLACRRVGFRDGERVIYTACDGSQHPATVDLSVDCDGYVSGPSVYVRKGGEGYGCVEIYTLQRLEEGRNQPTRGKKSYWCQPIIGPGIP